MRNFGKIQLTHLSSPNFENKHEPNTQLVTACDTSASCSDKGVLQPQFAVPKAINTTTVYIRKRSVVKCGFVIQHGCVTVLVSEVVGVEGQG